MKKKWISVDQSSVEFSTRVVIDLTEKTPIRILHVDDEAGFLKTAKPCLEMQRAFQVDTASSVEEAIEKMKKKTYDAIICDYTMPNKDGLQFLKELRDRNNNIPFIIFTGKGREDVAIKALNLGADRYFSKIGSPKTVYGELTHGLTQAVKQRRAEEMLRQSEERFRNLYGSILDPVCIFVGREGRLIDYNKAFKKLTGYSDEELKDKNLLDFVHSDDQAMVLEKYRTEYLEKELPLVYEIKGLNKKGETIPLEISVSTYKKEDRVVGILVILRDITERKKTEELYKGVVELSPESILTVDTKGVITSCNTAATRMLQYSKSEIIGKHFSRIGVIRKRDLPKFLKIFISALRGGITKPLELTFQRKDRTSLLAEVRVGLLKRGGKITGLQAISRDITEPKKALEALKESEEKYRILIDETPIGIVNLNIKGTITYANKAFEEITGFSRDEILGRSAFNLARETLSIPDENMKLVTKRIKNKLMGKSTGSMEVPLRRKDGSWKWLEGKSKVIRKLGVPVGLQAILRDVTERKKADIEIQENQQKFRQLFMGNPEAAVYVDSDFHILDINPRFKTLFGYSLDEIKGKHINQVVVQEDRMAEAEMLDTNAEKGYVYHDTLRKRKDGKLIPVSISAAPIIVEGRHAGNVGVYKDISQLKRTEKALKDALEKSVVLNEKLGVVGKLTRHDVRNKLFVVTSNIYLAKRKLADDPEIIEHLSEIESAVRQTERIFDFARMYEKLGMEKLTYIDAEKTLKDAVMLFSDVQNTKIVNDCKGLTVLADSLLQQLFYNLIHNSLEHGKKVSQIRVYCKEVGKDKLELIYEDDGVGIAKNEKEKIFREDYGKGTGHGLYLIRKMCEVYGWTIEETGKHGEGAQFTITLPKLNESGKEYYRLSRNR